MHLHAVLPRLADLARLDDEARAIISEMNVAIEFFVPGGPKVVLHFKNSSVRAVRTGKADVCLMFPTCKMLNDMFDGKKVTPIPIKGVHRMGDLKKLTRLTDILTRYLKPSQSEMADKEFRAKHVELSLLVGLAATEAIATIEAKGRRVASHMPSGTMLYDVKGGPKAHVISRWENRGSWSLKIDYDHRDSRRHLAVDQIKVKSTPLQPMGLAISKPVAVWPRR